MNLTLKQVFAALVAVVTGTLAVGTLPGPPVARVGIALGIGGLVAVILLAVLDVGGG